MQASSNEAPDTNIVRNEFDFFDSVSLFLPFLTEFVVWLLIIDSEPVFCKQV